jgi:hypothetical protein
MCALGEGVASASDATVDTMAVRDEETHAATHGATTRVRLLVTRVPLGPRLNISNDAAVNSDGLAASCCKSDAMSVALAPHRSRHSHGMRKCWEAGADAVTEMTAAQAAQVSLCPRKVRVRNGVAGACTRQRRNMGQGRISIALPYGFGSCGLARAARTRVW